MKSTPEQVEARYETHYDPTGDPHWVTREAATGQYVAYHYIQEAADRLTAKLNAFEAAEQDSARLAEIGRLAVEEEKLRCALKAKYLASGGKTDDCMGLYDTFFNAAVAHREAACAYLAKHPTP